MRFSFNIVLTILSLGLIQSKICPNIQISSNITRVKDDMAKNGETVFKWTKDSSTPIIIGSSKQIDYIYVTVENHEDLNISNFILKFDDNVYANSTYKLDISHPSSKETEYAVEVNYKCNDYGGSLVNYDLEVVIPDCGTSQVFWKKLCGNPLIPRDGLTIDIESATLNETIVKNGKIVNPSYFDQDIDNYVFVVGENTNITSFHIYMDNSSFLSNETDPVIKALRDMIRLVPETRFSKLKVDADESLLNPILTGKDINGGNITTQKMTVNIEYECKGRKGNSLVEFTIPLDYFKDITLFFLKSCDGVEDYVYKGHHELWAILIWIIVLLLMSCTLATLYNIFVMKKKGYDSVPGLEKSIKMALTVKYIRESRVGEKLNEINQVHFNALKGTSTEPEESEFKIENISEINNKDKNFKEQPTKYGSI